MVEIEMFSNASANALLETVHEYLNKDWHLVSVYYEANPASGHGEHCAWLKRENPGPALKEWLEEARKLPDPIL